MIEQGISPGERAILEDTLAKYSKAIITNPRGGVNIVSKIALEASRAFGKSPLKAMQQIFDQHDFPVKFVAIPADSDIYRTGVASTREGLLPSDISNYDIRMPHSGTTIYPYWLYTTINMPAEYNDLLARLETTPEENFERLVQTGLLFIKEGTEMSKIVQSKNN
ncbi:MAG: hypothetical protein AAB874_04270 [Patescibacteria group bacterium]